MKGLTKSVLALIVVKLTRRLRSLHWRVIGQCSPASTFGFTSSLVATVAAECVPDFSETSRNSAHWLYA